MIKENRINALIQDYAKAETDKEIIKTSNSLYYYLLALKDTDIITSGEFAIWLDKSNTERSLKGG